MEYRRMGRSGLQLSSLSFGSWVTFGYQISDQTAEKLMHTAYDAGINFFDNAETYAHGKSEEVMGNILARSGWDRSTYVVSSKVFWGGSKPNQKGLMRKHVVEACHAALRRLQVDYLDLFYCHRPDIDTPIEETVWTMHQLILQGKILYWGTSEWTAQQITEAFYIAEKYHLIGPSVEQPQYNMLHRKKIEGDYLPVFDRFGIGTTIWSPLASGLLTGKYINKTEVPGTRMELDSLSWLKEQAIVRNEHGEKVKQLKQLADQAGLSLTHLALLWCLRNPQVSSVILGASKVEQLEENLRCLDHKNVITADLEQAIEKILQNKPERIRF
jgi:voltage-dependent potassium channel beta subunit